MPYDVGWVDKNINMKTLKIYLFVLWCIAGLYLFNYSLEWLSAADTIVNTIGVLTIITVVFLSITIYKLTLKPKKNEDK